MTLLAEAFVGYLLLVLALRSLARLPGLTGRLARRTAFALAPAAVRRMGDVLVGGALLVQVTVAAPDPSPGHLSSGSCQAVVASSGCSRSGGPVTVGDPARIRLRAARLRLPVDEKEPVEARPIPRRSAAPLPPWLGGGPSKAAPLPPSPHDGPSQAAPGAAPRRATTRSRRATRCGTSPPPTSCRRSGRRRPSTDTGNRSIERTAATSAPTPT
jgi:hypothetical protein